MISDSDKRFRRHRGSSRAIAALGLAAALLVAGLGSGDAARAQADVADRPNVVVVMTDDQTVGQLAAMPNTRGLIGERGATFANSFVSFPLCCPSRATFLTGQYTHNNGVRNNYVPDGGFQLLDTDETLAVWLQRAGYTTAMIGKLMNGYNASPVGVPPGWSEWHAEKTENRYYGYELFEDGQRVTYGDPDEDPTNPAQPDTYSTDVYTDKAVDFISRESAGADPFFLWLSYNAPHSGAPDAPMSVPDPCRGNAKPAVRHAGAFADAPLPRPPSFNEADVSDKPRSVRNDPLLNDEQVRDIERVYRCELESLLAVDEGVKAVVDALAAGGELGRTYLLFTSDNGFLHGEHRFLYGKHRPYEEALRVPLLIRGPGIEPGTTNDELVANVDLAPTILDLADARPGLPQDGRRLLPILDRPERRLGREILIDTNRYQGIRNARYTYARYIRAPDRGEVELYDLKRDPFQLRSLDRKPRYRQVKRALERRTDELIACEGRECRRRPRLRLRPRGRTDCTRGFVELTLKGRDTDEAKRAAFSLRGETLRTDRKAPYAARLPSRRVRRAGGRVGAETTMLDGRVATSKYRLRC